VFGLGFFSVLLFWISIVGYVAWVLLIILQALFLSLFGLLWALLSRHDPVVVRVGLAALSWVAIELLRSTVPLGGFTWGQLAQSQHDLFYWTLRPAAFGGAWLVAALLVAINAVLAELPRATWAKRGVLGAAAVTLLALPLALPVASSDGPALRVGIVQGNVPQDFAGSFYDKELAITRSHARLTRSLDTSDLDLVVWPESSVGIDLRRDNVAADLVAGAARSAGVPMIVGGNLDLDAQRYKVVAFYVSPEGEVEDVYQKTHLVPFGEYVPGRDLLSWVPMLDQVPRDAVPGSRPHVFELPQGPIATVISFEGDFGSLVRRPIDAGGRALVVATNTSTWGHSWASAQHLAFSQVRSAENQVAVVHAALSGISGFIEPGGELVASTGLYEATTLTRTINFAPAVSFYARTGDWFAYLAVITTTLGLLALLRGRRVASEA
jgi:apolipoprotein N-acyltransferase